MNKKIVLASIVAVTLFQFAGAVGQDVKSATDLFKDRILPIFRSPNPSSCVQCHLSSVDLKNYILPSHEATFVSLRDQGLVDLDNPKASKILTLIDMGDKDSDKYSKRIHAPMRKAEYDAFSQWIIASCKDQKLTALPKSDARNQAGPPVSNEVIRHARKSRVMDSFVRNVWSQRMRCFPCHTENEIRPKQKGAKNNFDNWYSQFGDQMLIFKKTPEETFQYLVNESKDSDATSLPLLNLKEPNKSLLILKPMSKIPPKKDDRRTPTYTEPIYHMGGLKIHKNDHTHKAFLNWINDYASVSKGNYKNANELPTDNWFPTQRILRLRDLPKSLNVGSTMQMFVYPVDSDSKGLSNEPVAFTQGTVTPKRLVNGALILLGPTDKSKFEKWQSKHNKLSSENYVVKLYADKHDKLQSDPTLFLDDENSIGEILLKNAKWQVGFPKAEWISFLDIKK